MSTPTATIATALPVAGTPATSAEPTPPAVLLAHHLKELRLPTCLREYDRLVRQCASEGVDHVRYLLRLVELELIDRERRLVERRIKAARSSHLLRVSRCILCRWKHWSQVESNPLRLYENKLIKP